MSGERSESNGDGDGDDGDPVVLEDGETADAFRVLVENVANNAGVVRRRGVSDGR